MSYPVGYRFGKDHVFDPAQVRTFALLAGDTNPLHHEQAAAGASRFGGLIASGTHTSALLLGLTAEHFSQRGSVVGLGFGVEFLRAVRADARVRIEWEVRAVQDRGPGRGQVLELAGRMADADGAVCVSATGRVLVGAAL